MNSAAGDDVIPDAFGNLPSKSKRMSMSKSLAPFG